MSTPKRFFLENINYPEDPVVTLSGEEFTHAKTVLRVGVGSEITLMDNSGKEYSAIVDGIEKHCLSAHITGVNEGDKEPRTPVYLLIGALKGDKTELAVQKATELGVSKIGGFSSRYCSAYMTEGKLDRLTRVAREASKQCLRARAPEVEYFDCLEKALASCGEYKNKLFFCEFASRSEFDMSSLEGSTALVVGSEGGFSEEELDCAGRLGFAPMSLGKRILRAETAAICVCSVAAFCLGELK